MVRGGGGRELAVAGWTLSLLHFWQNEVVFFLHVWNSGIITHRSGTWDEHDRHVEVLYVMSCISYH